ncbi:MAG TPA: hypothetical protein VMT88_01470, partial [Actinomycetes bacterium]|nr:hypothetical protein [Actinomycetes bacterium]
EPAILTRSLPGPRARSIGAIQLVAGLCMAPALWSRQTLTGCVGHELIGTPASALLMLAIVASGCALVLGVPRCSAIAPALAAGAAVLLLGAAAAGWASIGGTSCLDVGVDSPGVLLVVQTGGSLAVLVAAVALLYARDEFEPWGGAHGVIAASAAAATTLVIGVGFTLLIAVPAGFSGLSVILAVALPWAVCVGATGWLRRSPAIAVVACMAVQAIWLLVEFI